MWVKYVRALQETIRVYAAGGNQIRADHVVRFWGMTFLRLHYRLRRVSAGEGVASIESTVKR